jgi:ABC-type sugar transport system ATPase subunit
LQASVQVGSSTIVASVNAHHLVAGSAVHVGVRPEDIRVVSEGNGENRLVGGVSHVERLGDCSMLYVELGQGLPMLTVSVDGTAALHAGDRVTLQLSPDTLHLFDADGMACHRTVDLPN